ncbi:MAG TPA: hypothetical protein VIY73_24560 [Polyangiaceae bacterium]|jgi:hypothetical protein
MLVPTMAFALWIVSLPTTQPPVSLDGLLAGSEHLDATGERVKPKLITPELVDVAASYLDLPMGAERFLTLHGKRYVFVLEQHYHPPGYVGGPTGYHKGVTVYEVHATEDETDTSSPTSER